MIGIIVTGHGNFATGLLSSMKLIAGEQNKVIGIDFLEGYTIETLESKLKEAISKLGDEILVLADLAGGSPFKESVLLKNSMEDKNMEVISGTNLPMLLETVLMREGMTVEELSSFSINSGSQGIMKFINKKKEVEVYEEVDELVGI